MAGLFGILIASGAVTVYEFRQICRTGGKREAIAFAVLMAVVSGIGIAVHYQVPFPNPLAGIEAICKAVLGF